MGVSSTSVRTYVQMWSWKSGVKSRHTYRKPSNRCFAALGADVSFARRYSSLSLLLFCLIRPASFASYVLFRVFHINRFSSQIMLVVPATFFSLFVCLLPLRLPRISACACFTLFFFLLYYEHAKKGHSLSSFKLE